VITAATLTGSSAGGTALALDKRRSARSARFTRRRRRPASCFDGTALTSMAVDADFLTIAATGRMTLAGNIATIGAPLSQQSGSDPGPGRQHVAVVTPPRDPRAQTQFVQTGTSQLTDPPGTTLRIQLPRAGGTATFANLDGPGANLVLALGTARPPAPWKSAAFWCSGQGGAADLFGSVAGVTTQAAAALGRDPPGNQRQLHVQRLRHRAGPPCGAPTPHSSRRHSRVCPCGCFPARPCRGCRHCRRWNWSCWRRRPC